VSQDLNEIEITFAVNGKNHTVKTHPLKRLLDILRDVVGMTGTKEGCGEGECGACTVILEGRPSLSCLVPACQVSGSSIRTVEGLASGDSLHPMQQAFIEGGGAQCGICTPGMLMSAVHYQEHPEVAENMREALAGNQCRCTGYTKIFNAVAKALEGAGVEVNEGPVSTTETWPVRRVP